MFYFFFFKQKTAYEMRISDWSSDVCSSDLVVGRPVETPKTLRRTPKGWEDFLATGMAPALDGMTYVARAVTPTGRPRRFNRSEERREGKECVSTCRSRWSTYHQKKN